MKEIDLLSTHVTHINEKKVQGQTLRYELICEEKGKFVQNVLEKNVGSRFRS